MAGVAGLYRKERLREGSPRTREGQGGVRGAKQPQELSLEASVSVSTPVGSRIAACFFWT